MLIKSELARLIYRYLVEHRDIEQIIPLDDKDYSHLEDLITKSTRLMSGNLNSSKIKENLNKVINFEYQAEIAHSEKRWNTVDRLKEPARAGSRQRGDCYETHGPWDYEEVEVESTVWVTDVPCRVRINCNFDSPEEIPNEA